MFKRIRRIEGVSRIVAVCSGNLLPDEFRETGWSEVRFYTYDSDNHAIGFFPPSPGLSLQTGEIPPVEDESHILLGYELASSLGLEVGDKTVVRGREFTVGGVWAPSPLIPGNYVQISLRAAHRLVPGIDKGYDELLVYVRPGIDPNQVAWRIWQDIPGLQVVPPMELYLARVRNQRIGMYTSLYVGTIAFMASVLVLAYALVGGGLTGNAAPDCTFGRRRPLQRGLILGITSALMAVLVGWVFMAWLNHYSRRMYAFTVAAFSLRYNLGVLALGVLAGIGAGLIASLRLRWMERGVRPAMLDFVLRYGVGCLFVALTVIGLVVSGALVETTFTALAEAKQLAVDRIGLKFPVLSKQALHRLLLMPGLQGITIEAYGGAIQEDEEGWGDGLPASGVFYGVNSSNSRPGVTILHPAPIRVGRDIRRDSPNEVIVGYDLARRFGLRPGDPLVIRDRTFIVTGIREPLAYGIPSDFNMRADISMEAFRRIFGHSPRSGTVTIFVPPVKSEEERKAFIDDLAARLGTGQIMDITAQENEMAIRYPGAMTIQKEARDEPARQVKTLYSLCFLLWLIWLLWLVGHVWYALSAFESLSKREEINLRRLFGATDNALVGEMMAHNMTLGAFGALIGVAGAWWLIAGINAWIGRTGYSALPLLLITLRLVVVPIALMMLMGALMAIGPIVEILREEPATFPENTESPQRTARATVAT